MSSFTEEMVGNQKIVKGFSYEKRAEKTFSEINAQMGKSGVKAVFFSSMTNPTTRFVNGLIYAAVGTAGALSAIGALNFLELLQSDSFHRFFHTPISIQNLLMKYPVLLQSFRMPLRLPKEFLQ